METIVTHPHFKELGTSLTEQHEELVLANIDFDVFPDEWPNIFINDTKEIEHQHITYIADLSKKEYLFDNYSMIRALSSYYANKVRVIVPFFPVGTMERISKKGEVATSKYMADILSTIPNGRTHKSSIHIFDMHSLEQLFFFDENKVNTELHTAMNLIKEKITPDTVIIFPDAGAKKRFENDFSEHETIYCSKKRQEEKREIHIESDIDVTGKECIIIDDLIQSGGTIVETAKKLRELGAKKIDAFATHGVFVKDAEIKLGEVLDTLYTTDSIPQNKEKLQHIENAEILSLQDTIYKKIISIT